MTKISHSGIDQVGPTSCNSAGRVEVDQSLQGKLVEFASVLSEHFGVPLPVPDFTGEPVAALKKFCGTLLEGSGSHQWARSLRLLSAQERLTIAGSLFSFRKVLPTDDPSTSEYVQRMATPRKSVPNHFLTFVRKETRKIFKGKWDRDWRKFVLSCTPSSSSGIGCVKKSGGVRGNLNGSRGWFLSACMGLEKHLNISTVREVNIARLNGKARVVTSSPPEAVVLSPLHSMIYAHLTKTDWLLRGEATPDRFSGFERQEGEIFVSGDYESATDNISIEVAEAILETILSNCGSVPVSVRRVAMESLRCVLTDGVTTGMQMRGQLMGNFLSFPLLCLQNYLAFRYLAGECPVKINGDDIVARMSHGKYQRWAEGVNSLGLTLSLGKTMVHNRFFSLNSTYFRSTKTSVKGVPILRATLLFSKVESADSITGRFNSIGTGWSDADSSKWRVYLLRKMHHVIRTTQRSLTRGLGINVSNGEIVKGGFGPWEDFYLSRDFESRPPSKSAVQGALPSGWSKFRDPFGGDVEDDPGFSKALRHHSWNSTISRVKSDEYWSKVREKTEPFVKRTSGWWRSHARLLKLSVRKARAYLKIKLPEQKKRGKSGWRRSTDRIV